MIFLNPSHLDQMIKAAQASFPKECCGLLTGVKLMNDVHTVIRVISSPNIHQNGGKDRFEVDPGIRLKLMRELGEVGNREAGPERLIGHYHSHPNHSAFPSEEDLKYAFEPDLFWIILGVEKGRVHQVCAHQFCIHTALFKQISLRQTTTTKYAEIEKLITKERSKIELWK